MVTNIIQMYFNIKANPAQVTYKKKAKIYRVQTNSRLCFNSTNDDRKHNSNRTYVLVSPFHIIPHRLRHLRRSRLPHRFEDRLRERDRRCLRLRRRASLETLRLRYLR